MSIVARFRRSSEGFVINLGRFLVDDGLSVTLNTDSIISLKGLCVMIDDKSRSLIIPSFNDCWFMISHQ